MADAQWVQIQRKTFTGWCNSHLRKVGIMISDITKDFEDGMNLIRLLEIIAADTITGYNKNAKMRVQKVINIGLALKFITSKGVKLVGVGAEEICDGNLKMILGMIWTIILRFQISDISEEELSAKEALLLWCQKKTKGYNGVNVKEFTFSWQDGLAFCALIHKHRPDLIDYDSLDHSDKKGNLTKAFEAAEKHLDVPAILDVNDIVDVAKPDERSIMTYVAALYHVFSKSNKGEAAAKTISSILDFEQTISALKDEYARRAQALKDWTETATAQFNDRQFPNSIEGVQGKIGEFKTWKKDQKTSQGQEKSAVEQLFNQIQTKLRINKRSAYVAPAGLEPEALGQVWEVLNKAETEYGAALRDELRRQRQLQAMVDGFNLRAGSLEHWLSDKEKLVSATELGNSIDSVSAALTSLESFHDDYQAQTKKLQALNELKDKIVAGGHRDHEAVASKQNQLQASWEALGPKHDARKEALQAQLAKLQKIQELLGQYAKKALAVMRALEAVQDTTSEPILADSLEDVNTFDAEYQKAAAEFQAQQAEHDAVTALATEIRELEVSETLYSEYSVEAIAERWGQVQGSLEKRAGEIEAERSRQEANEQLRLKWAEAAGAFVGKISQQEAALKAAEASEGKIEETVEQVRKIAQDIHGLQGEFDALNGISQELEDNEVWSNKHTEITAESAKLSWDGVNGLAANTIKVLENEMLIKQHSGVSADELAEYKETFSHFDKDGSNQLNRLELKSCLTSLGEDVKDADLDKILADFGILVEEKGENVRVLPFNSFVAYLVKKNSDTDSVDAIKQAFKIMANDKEFITRNELSAHLPKDKVDYLVSQMPPYGSVEGGLDYNAYAAKVYAH